MSTEGVYRTTNRNLLKEIRRENFEKSLVDYKGIMLFIGVGVPKFELLVSPARKSIKTWNLKGIEEVCRATSRKISKKKFIGKILRKVLWKKGRFFNLQTTILKRVPKFELPGTPPTELSKGRTLVSIEGVNRVTFAYKRPYWDWYPSSSSRVPLLGSFQRDKSWWVQRTYTEELAGIF